MRPDEYISRVFDLPTYCKSRYGSLPALAFKQDGEWRTLSYVSFDSLVDQYAQWLVAIGVSDKEIVATISSINSPIWNILDMAIMKAGGVHLPLYPNLSAVDHDFILQQADVIKVLVDGKVMLDKIKGLSKSNAELKVYNLAELHGQEFQLRNQDVGSQEARIVEERSNCVKPDDLASIVYTSGTTGKPKGVMLSHRNLVSNFMMAAELHTLSFRDKALSFLPLSHLYERTANYSFLKKGVLVYYCSGLNKLMPEFMEVRPEGFTAVPRILEKALKPVVSEIKRQPQPFKWLLHYCMRKAFKYEPFGYRFLGLQVWRWVLEHVVFKKFRDEFGGRLKYLGCGGAPIHEKIERFYWAAGVPVYQGYGLTECSPLVSLNRIRFASAKIGTVGTPIPGIEVKLLDDGEICCKGSNVMLGYFRLPELTKKTVENGWLRTGDLGSIEDGRYLKIIGRKKEMFKTSYGKYIVPHIIESKLKELSLVNNAMVFGEGKSCAAAIIELDVMQFKKELPDLASSHGQQIIDSPTVKEKIKGLVAQINKQLGRHEQLKKYIPVVDKWSIETGELTPSLKLKREAIKQKYADQIAKLFQGDSLEL